MRKILVSIFIMFAVLSVKAQNISGIRIDGGDNPILVYFGGSQMCSPTTSCFVANLKSGYYQIEVYASRITRRGERLWKGQRLYSSRVYFNGTGVKDIYAGTQNGSNRPGGRPHQDSDTSDYEEEDDEVMNARLFDSFYKTVQRETSDANRIKVIDSVIGTTNFTCNQCLRLTELFRFDGDKIIIMKKMYPYLVDKQAFFSLIGALKYTEHKNEMNAFVKNYNASAQ